eukprot:5694487-Alexandrium_andersonii.AAC.1
MPGSSSPNTSWAAMAGPRSSGFRRGQPGRRARVRRASALPCAAGRYGPEPELAMGIGHVAGAPL